MDTSLALIIFSSIAVTSCVFLASYFLFIKKENKLKNFTLGFLFIAIALRISKSIFYYALPEISNLGIAIGFFGFASMGPLSYLYYSIDKLNLSKLSKATFLHFIIPIIGFVFIVIDRDFAFDLYFLANLSFIGYLGFIAFKYFYKQQDYILSSWNKSLFYAMAVLSGILIFQLFGGTMKNYSLGIAFSSAVMYFLFFNALKSPTVLKKNPEKTLPKDLLQKIKLAIEKDKIYLQPSITLNQFSKTIDTPTYLVSKAVKCIYDKSFPEVLNSFRIKAITEKLRQSEIINEKIEDLAFDVGFNTSSTFYNAFKKETSMSPREYQREMQKKAILEN